MVKNFIGKFTNKGVKNELKFSGGISMGANAKHKEVSFSLAQ